MYISAGILLLASLCLIGFGGITLYGSTAPNGQANWASIGVALSCVGVLMLAGGILLIWLAIRKQKQEAAQNVTLKIDLPGETKIEAMKCRSCGGELTADNIKLVNGAPMVTCPYCNTVYQLTEEPKW
jgi:hypothetical protein